MSGDSVTPIASGLFTVADGPVRLIGSQCARCGTVAFPRQASCPKCTSVNVTQRLLARRGTLWSWTIELPGEVRVEARLTEADPDRLRIGMPMELTLVPAPGGQARGVVTYAFRPVAEEPNHGGAG